MSAMSDPVMCPGMPESPQRRGRSRWTSIRSVIGRAADALAESLAEVDRLRQAVDNAVHLYHATLEERDEALAAIERVRELHEPLECPCGTCDVVICAECLSEAHPCPTIRALDGGESAAKRREGSDQS